MDLIRLVKNLNPFSESEPEPEPRKPSLAQYEPLMDRLSEMDELSVKDIMIPRSILVGLDVDLKPERIQSFVSEAPSHILVYRGDLDSIEGWISKEELAEHLQEGQSLEAAVHDVGRVSENLTLKDLFLRFVAISHPLLAVIDDEGHLSGVVHLQTMLNMFFGIKPGIQ